MYIKYMKNNNYNNLFLIFIFLFYKSLTAKLDGNAFVKKFSISSHSTELMILLLLNIPIWYVNHFI